VETIQTDQDVDQLFWSIIKDSRNPKDFLDYVRHAEGREAGHDVALVCANALWPANTDPKALFPNVILTMESLASYGDTTAMFHQGRWHRLGYGVVTCSETSLSWYGRGAQAADPRCLLADHLWPSTSQRALTP